MHGTDEGSGHHHGRQERHRRHHQDFAPPWMRPRGGWFGPPHGRGRARRGDVRTALLTVVAEHPMHGYDLIRELEERSGGMWHPSPGSIYPTLQMLEEQGLLTSEDVDGKHVYSITDEGRAHLEERQARSDGAPPWEMAREGRERFGKLFGSMSQLGAAVMQVARAGSSEQVDRVTTIVAEARKKVYAVLAED